LGQESAINLVSVYVRLLDEGTDCSRPTQAEPLGNGLFKLRRTPNYDPEDEPWEFLPGSVVRTVTKEYEGYEGKELLFAVKAQAS
jgi:hypothetical protein